MLIPDVSPSNMMLTVCLLQTAVDYTELGLQYTLLFKAFIMKEY